MASCGDGWDDFSRVRVISPGLGAGLVGVSVSRRAVSISVGMGANFGDCAGGEEVQIGAWWSSFPCAAAAYDTAVVPVDDDDLCGERWGLAGATTSDKLEGG